MNLFHLHVEKEQGTMPRPQTWLVVADSLFDAMSVVPDDIAVRAVEVQVGAAVDPRRVIRRVAALVVH